MNKGHGSVEEINGVVTCVMTGTIDVPEMQAFVEAHNQAIDKVWVDLRALKRVVRVWPRSVAAQRM